MKVTAEQVEESVQVKRDSMSPGAERAWLPPAVLSWSCSPTPSQVYGMFPSWYNFYPYQVAEYDECPAHSPWDFPRPLSDPAPREGLRSHSIIWRPWLSEGVDLFSFFRVDAPTLLLLGKPWLWEQGTGTSHLRKQSGSRGHWREGMREKL